MKLDATNLRYLTPDQFRVLQAVEIGSRNHEIVPISLICQIAKQRSSGATAILYDLINYKLISKEFASGKNKYEGYRMCYGGLDFLALKKFCIRGSMTLLGNQIGVGKEADIYLGYTDSDETVVLKIHRLGRTSFRTVRNNRDYLQSGRCSDSWLHLSCLSASKEFSYLEVLHSTGIIPVPTPIDHNRHCILMQWIDGIDLSSVRELPESISIESLYEKLMGLIQTLAECGLIHGDFNEFNLLITHAEPHEIVLIDFPQMISINHVNAEEFYERDIECVRRWFQRKFNYEHSLADSHGDVRRLEEIVRNEWNLDVKVEASGYDRKLRRKVILAERAKKQVANDEIDEELCQ